MIFIIFTTRSYIENLGVFVMLVPNRHGNSGIYRYGFNGKENDNEVMGEANWQDYGMRMYNPRIGRFPNVDPLTKRFTDLSPYQFASNSPIAGIDLDGLEFYYTADGKFLGKIGTSQQVYTADKIETKTREVSDSNGKMVVEKYQIAVNEVSLNVTHNKFQKAANVVMQEGISQLSSEYLWIAHTNNNNAKSKNMSFTDRILSSYSSVTDKGPLDDKTKTNRANFSRAGVINVLSGGADPTGGAKFWDGADFLAWGLNSPNGTPQAKFEQYKSITIPTSIYDSFLSSTQESYPKGYNYGTGKDAKGKKTYFHSDVPDGVFTDKANWGTGDFKYNTGVKNQPNLEATGAQGGTIFWKTKK